MLLRSLQETAREHLLTEAVTRIQRVQFDATPLPSNLLLTVINIEYQRPGRGASALHRRDAGGASADELV